MPLPVLPLLAVLALGCASTAPVPRNDRIERGRDVAAGLSAALDALGDLGVRPVTVRPRAGGGVLVGRVRAEGPPWEFFEVEVRVLPAGDGVRIAVAAEPAEALPSAHGSAGAMAAGAAPGSACACPGREPLQTGGPSRDNLKALSRSRTLVRTYLGLLDAHLR